MNTLSLPNVTLVGIDCVDVARLQEALNISELHITFGASKLLTSLPNNDPRKVEIPHIGGTLEYSNFCINELHKYVDTDYVLIVQYDGFVLNAQSWDAQFLNYDYIGAPWFVNDILINKYGFPEKLRGTFIVGNGGFSLRSKKLLTTCARLASEKKLSKIHPEDNVICISDRSLFETEGITFAPSDLGLRFSIEGENNVTYTKQFGFHNFKWTNIDDWINEHPEYVLTVNNYKKLCMRGTVFPS